MRIILSLAFTVASSVSLLFFYLLGSITDIWLCEMPGGVSEYTQDARNGDKEDIHLYPPFCDSVYGRCNGNKNLSSCVSEVRSHEEICLRPVWKPLPT